MISIYKGKEVKQVWPVDLPDWIKVGWSTTLESEDADSSRPKKAPKRAKKVTD